MELQHLELDRNWEREVRHMARNVFSKGYKDVLDQLIRAARAIESGEDVAIYIQHEPWDDKVCAEEQSDLERAEPSDLIGLLDRALGYGVAIEFCTENDQYEYLPEEV